MNDTTPAIRPFVTAVPDQAIDDLKARLARTRRPARDPGLVGEVRDVVDRPVPGVRRSHRLPHRSMRGATVMPTGIDIGAQHPGTLRDRSA